MPHWVMVVDLRKCIGCSTCVHVCSYGNQNPPGSPWRKLSEQTLKTDSGQERLFVTIACMHCETPPCREVCPTLATQQTESGIVIIDESLCIGCGACVTACPYYSRVITNQDVAGSADLEPLSSLSRNRIGICTKCDFCIERIAGALGSEDQPGEKIEATPYCAWYCISDALLFGDAEDAESDVSRILSESSSIVLEESLGTKPSVFYIIE